jgi:hypothetical protein
MTALIDEQTKELQAIFTAVASRLQSGELQVCVLIVMSNSFAHSFTAEHTKIVDRGVY